MADWQRAEDLVEDVTGLSGDERIRAELERLRIENAYMRDTSPALGAENMRLQAEVERLRANFAEIVERSDGRGNVLLPDLMTMDVREFARRAQTNPAGSDGDATS